MSAAIDIAHLQAAERFLEERDLLAARHAFHQAELAGAPLDRCASGRWLVSMLAGDFAAAWRESDAICSHGAPDPHRFWHGESLHGARVIVRCLHGFGDAVQMLRYAPMLQARAAHVVYEVPPRLIELAPHFNNVEHVITWGEHAPCAPTPWDAQLEIMELPYLFRTALDELPIAARYLQLLGSMTLAANQAMGNVGHPRVGVVWASGEWNPSRSIPFSLMRPLLSEPRIQFWNLQGATAAAEADDYSGFRNAIEVCGDGIVALAGTIANLDLVITVDTLAAHLAGALGKPVWLLLQYAADWRWMIQRHDSPWYPTMRIFRQPEHGNWAAVIHGVRESLPQFCAEVATRVVSA